jgi:hypothetical protein
MKNHNSLKKIIFILSLFVLVLFVAQYFVYRDIKIKNQKISVAERDLLLQENRQEYLISTEKLITAIGSDLQKIDASILAVDGEVNFINSLEDIAAKNKLKFDPEFLGSDENDPTLKNTNIKTFTIRAKITGSWADTYTFISELESNPVKIKINNLSISNVSSDSGIDVKKNGSIWQSVFEIVVLKYK